MTEGESKVEELAAAIAADTKELDKETQLQRDDGRALSKQSKLAERFLAKRQLLATRKDDCSRSIRDLGVLPEEAFEKYTKEKPERVSLNRVLRASSLIHTIFTAS
jgi:structural maintenance of chromosome 3 (chondroitin sulfate proteoglycan 6)